MCSVTAMMTPSLAAVNVIVARTVAVCIRVCGTIATGGRRAVAVMIAAGAIALRVVVADAIAVIVHVAMMPLVIAAGPAVVIADAIAIAIDEAIACSGARGGSTGHRSRSRIGDSVCSLRCDDIACLVNASGHELRLGLLTRRRTTHAKRQGRHGESYAQHNNHDGDHSLFHTYITSIRFQVLHS